MSIQMKSPKEFLIVRLIHFIVEHARERSGPIRATDGSGKRANYDTLIDEALTELIRLYLREIAQGYLKAGNNRKAILQLAFNVCERELNERLAEHPGVQFNFKSRFNHIEKELNSTAGELVELAGNLEYAKESKRIGSQNRFLTGRDVQLDLHELGLSDSITGLMIRPNADNFSLNIDNLNSDYTIVGEWFPFEVRSNNRAGESDFVFVLDDDGTIFISTVNYPPRLRDEARAQLERLAHAVFSPH